MEGWISTYRKILENPIVCKDSDYFAVWMYLLLNATHKESPAIFNKKKIILKKGQLITGRKAIAEKFDISESKVQRILKTFEIEQQIKQQTCSQNRLISIINWNEYQQSEQRIEQQVNNERTTSEQLVNTNNNDNNIYLCLFNKYKVENRRSFSEYMKKTKALREDEKWDLLTKEEQTRLMSEI
ncbi:MAG: hypothetical protein ACLTXD_01745 [Clostridia bacterium]|jgi:hypothetical protein